MTKNEEKALFTEIIGHCPDGYVKDILAGMSNEVENAINNDFGFVTLSDRYREMTEHKAAIDSAKLELSQLKTQIRELQTDRRVLETGINELRSIVKTLTRI